MRINKGVLAMAALLALVWAGAAIAQEQVGSIEGIVSDDAGQALPGVTVEATEAKGAKVMAVTDANGLYRFPRLFAGIYKLTAKLDGFVTAEATDVRLVLGKNLKVNFTMRPGRFEDEITVIAGQAQIDVKQAATATVIGKQELEYLPRGRDFTSVVSQAAGAQQEAFLAGISIDGASGSENRFVIDGVDTTHPQDGISGQSMITDFVEEVQVKSAGYAAEYGGALGGVINAITKTGGRDFAGQLLTYYNTSSWTGEQRKIGYESNCGTPDDCLLKPNKDKFTRWEPGISLGGPILKDSLWFFFAYQPSTLKTERTPVWNSDGSGPATKSYDQTVTETYLTANLKGAIGSSFFYKAAFNYTPAKVEDNLPARDVEPAPGVDLAVTTRAPSP
ncbi:MAG TPA: TonB-dependent receptor [Thermoanaerobaculaceae bacterium]|nr:TonB-dependent receptor [Thermoanaerobaculaceae bacterium]HRS16848.1 TonB-dependent receptor [Thermoanaerobaculaceae bacterium]